MMASGINRIHMIESITVNLFSSEEGLLHTLETWGSVQFLLLYQKELCIHQLDVVL